MKFLGYGLLLLGIYLAFDNSNYVSEEELNQQQSFCDNHDETMGTLHDSVDVLTVNQNETYTYKYDYVVNGQTYQKTAPVSSKNIGGVPPMNATIYYQTDKPEVASTQQPCDAIDGLQQRQKKKIWFYSGIALAVVGFVLSRIKGRS